MVWCALPFGEIFALFRDQLRTMVMDGFDVPHDCHAYNNTPVIAPTSVFFVHGKIEASSLALFFLYLQLFPYSVTCYFLASCIWTLLLYWRDAREYHLSMTGQANKCETKMIGNTFTNVHSPINPRLNISDKNWTRFPRCRRLRWNLIKIVLCFLLNFLEAILFVANCIYQVIYRPNINTVTLVNNTWYRTCFVIAIRVERRGRQADAYHTRLTELCY